MSANNLSGQTYGKLTVIEKLNERQNHYVVWRCQCECGGEILVNTVQLKRGTVQNCGCSPCKTRKLIRDISNQRFGRLVALYPTAQRDKKQCIYWHCRCDCGTEVNVTSDQLLHQNYKSCGCMKRENQREIFKQLHFVDGTCVEWLEKRKNRCDNKSGFRGVYQVKSGKYRVTIGFRRQRYYLGSYASYDEAVRIRQEAEKNLHGRFLEAFYQWKRRTDQDPEWAKINQFTYNLDSLFQVCEKKIIQNAEISVP